MEEKRTENTVYSNRGLLALRLALIRFHPLHLFFGLLMVNRFCCSPEVGMFDGFGISA